MKAPSRSKKESVSLGGTPGVSSKRWRGLGPEKREELKMHGTAKSPLSVRPEYKVRDNSLWGVTWLL